MVTRGSLSDTSIRPPVKTAVAMAGDIRGAFGFSVLG